MSGEGRRQLASGPAPTRYLAHGYVVSSDLPLPALPLLADDEQAGVPRRADNLTLRRGEPRTVPADPLPGTELGRFSDAHLGIQYVMARHRGIVTLRYPGACEFRADTGLRSVRHHSAPGADEDLVAVLASGTLLAVRLLLDSELLLHASAVAVNGAAVAFVGRSGMGKSTMAALSCAAGADLLTDDVLRVEDPGGRPIAWPGAAECRLRAGSVEVAAMCGDAATPRVTADGRTAMAGPRLANSPVPLAACVLPAPSRQARAVEVHRLGQVAAVLALCAYPRVVGWREPAGLARQFELLATLVRSIPVYTAVVPWGPPFDAGVAADVLDRVLDGRAALTGMRAPAG